MKLLYIFSFIFFLSTQALAGQGDTTSYIQVVDVYSGKMDTILAFKGHVEAPNWHRDNYLIVNSYGKLYTIDLKSRKMALLNTGTAQSCNNDHLISPDGKWLGISNTDANDTSTKLNKSIIYIMPINGGQPRRVTPNIPSYLHGWSPDGKTLVYCAERNGDYDVYAIPVEGGTEKRITTTEGLDDGPEYSADGKYIYFNSYRSGHMHLWRMLADGSQPEQLTFDENSNWFAHPSPNNQSIVYLAYTSDEKQQHLFGKDVKLRLMDLKTRKIRDLTPVFYGGQGTINVPSWSADSRKLAFVSYTVN